MVIPAAPQVKNNLYLLNHLSSILPNASQVVWNHPAGGGLGGILAGLTGIDLALGVRSANFNWTDPRRMAGGAAGCLSMVASVAYLGLAVLLFFGPPVGAPLLGIPEWIGRLVGLLVGGAAALLCAALPLALVKERVPHLGEE